MPWKTSCKHQSFQGSNSGSLSRRSDHQKTAVVRDLGGAARPQNLHLSEPVPYLVPKEPVDRILSRAELAAETIPTQNRHSGGPWFLQLFQAIQM